MKDDRLNPEQLFQKHEEETNDGNRAKELFHIAIERWGPSAKLMLQGLADGLTDKAAAKAAGISPPALRSRIKTLKKLVDR